MSPTSCQTAPPRIRRGIMVTSGIYCNPGTGNVASGAFRVQLRTPGKPGLSPLIEAKAQAMPAAGPSGPEGPLAPAHQRAPGEAQHQQRDRVDREHDPQRAPRSDLDRFACGLVE